MSKIVAEVEESVKALLHQGKPQAAVEAFVQGYGRVVLEFLHHRISNRDTLAEVYSDFCENLCRDLASFRGDSAVLTWALHVAGNAVYRRLKQVRKVQSREVACLDDAGEALQRHGRAGLLDAGARTDTHPYKQTPLIDRIAEIKKAVSENEQRLVALYLVENLTWEEVAERLHGPLDGRQLTRTAQALRKQYSRLMVKLALLLDADGQNRLSRLLDGFQGIDKMLVQRVLVERQPWQRVCAEVTAFKPDLPPQELRRQLRWIVVEVEKRSRDMGLLPQELLHNGIFSALDLPHSGPAQSGRRRGARKRSSTD